MSKKKLATGKLTTRAEKLAAWEEQFREWDEDEITINFAYLHFRMFQTEKGNSKQTIDFYDRFYKKLIAHLDTFSKGKGKEMPVKWLMLDGSQRFFMDSLGEVSVQTVNAYLRGYRAFGNYCEEKGWILGFKCPIKEVDPPIKEVYTDKELKALLVTPKIENFEEYRNFAIINLMLNTGARVNTILNIKIKDVDLDEGYISFNTTKAHKVVRLGLEPKAKRVLKEYVTYWRSGDRGASPNDYLFCNTYGEQLTRSGLTKAIAHYNQKRGVKKTSIHLFRHTFAKIWITKGGDIITLAKVLTHSELEMVKRYANLYSEDVKTKIEEYSALAHLREHSGKTLKTRERVV